MLKQLYAVFICLIVGLIIWFLIRTPDDQVLAIKSPLPKLNFINKSGNTDYLHPQGKMIMIVYFRSTCDHCQYQLQVLNSHCKNLFGLKLYLFTSEQNFFQKQIKWAKLKNAENITFGIVNKNHFYKNFGTIVTPSIFIFDQGGALTKKIHGEIKFEILLQEIAHVHKVQER